MIQRLEAAWFAPAPAARLAVIRVVLGVFFVATVVTAWDDVPGLSSDPGARFIPVGLARVLPGPISASALGFVQVVVVALGVLWTVGLAWRVVAPLFAFAVLFWGAYRLSWGAIAHDLHLPALHVVVLALAPAAAALSLDARRPSALAWRTPARSWHHGWALRLLCVVTAAVYVLAGWSKLDFAGLAWGSGDNLLAQVAYAALLRSVYDPDAGEPTALPILRAHGWLLSAGSVLTLIVEIGAPLALFHRYLGWSWALATLAMHQGIALLMGISFPYQTFGLAFLCFLPVERLLPAAWRPRE
jgi:hypothetical protein